MTLKKSTARKKAVDFLPDLQVIPQVPFLIPLF